MKQEILSAILAALVAGALVPPATMPTSARSAELAPGVSAPHIAGTCC